MIFRFLFALTCVENCALGHTSVWLLYQLQPLTITTVTSHGSFQSKEVQTPHKIKPLKATCYQYKNQTKTNTKMKIYYSLFTSIITAPTIRCLSSFIPRATSARFLTSFSPTTPTTIATQKYTPISLSYTNSKLIRFMTTIETGGETTIVDTCRQKIQAALGTDDVIVTGTYPSKH